MRLDPYAIEDEYVQIAKKVTNPEQKVFATTGTMSAEPPTNLTYDLYPLIYQAGGDVIDEKTNKAVFNSPAGVKAVQWYVDLMNVHKVSVPGMSAERAIKLDDGVLRHLITIYEHELGAPPMTAEELAAQKKRGDDDDDEEE